MTLNGKPYTVRIIEATAPPVQSTPLPRWTVTRIVLDVIGGTIPPLPPRLETIEARHYYEAREEAARRLGLPKEAFHLERVS